VLGRFRGLFSLMNFPLRFIEQKLWSKCWFENGRAIWNKSKAVGFLFFSLHARTVNGHTKKYIFARFL
jgi:hypothetical protein